MQLKTIVLASLLVLLFSSAALAQAPVGDPGVAYGYQTMLGTPHTPYLIDVQHLNGPYGIAIDSGDNIYIGEVRGQRILKYRLADGADLWAVGKAGLLDTGANFNEPKEVAIDGYGHLWMADSNRVIQFDAVSGEILQMLPAEDDEPWKSGSGNDRFDRPYDIEFDTAGKMYVADSDNHRIQVFDFDTDGNLVYHSTIGQAGVAGSDNSHFDTPWSLAVDSSNRIYVGDNQNYRIQRCEYNSGWSCTAFHGTGSEGGGMNEVGWTDCLHIDAADSIFVCDGTNDGRVKKCDASGACVNFAEEFWWPSSVDFDSSGNVYIADNDRYVIEKFSPAGTSLGVVLGVNSVPYRTDGVHLNRPAALTTDDAGNLYASTNGGVRVVSMTADGAPRWAAGEAGVWARDGSDNLRFGASWTGPQGLAATADDKLLVADIAHHRIQILDSATGAYQTTIGDGDCGGDNDQFCGPADVAIDGAGNIYVADQWNHRVQIFNAAWRYQATLGATGEEGSANNRFDDPIGVAIDEDGNIYVADQDNHRVQIFDSNRTYRRTIGVTGVNGSDFRYLDRPKFVTIDAAGRIYVNDNGNQRVQVFDAQGRYLATIDGDWGDYIYQHRGATATAVDDQGNIYVADEGNHRIKKLALGVPGWRQININGFGNADNSGIGALEGFQGQLYAGTLAKDGTADLWRYDGLTWSVVDEDFGGANSDGLDDLIAFDEKLYAGIWNDTDGGAIYRSNNGSNWEAVATGGMDNPTNTEFFRFGAFDGALYASTWNTANGFELWRSPSGDAGSWTKVIDGGLGNPDNGGGISLQSFNDYLYLATYNPATGVEAWRSSTGDSGSWQRINTDGFGDSARWAASFEVFGGDLYAATFGDTRIYRCRVCDGSDWAPVVDDEFGNRDNAGVESLIVFQNKLYALVKNRQTGLEVWSSGDGAAWEVVTAQKFAGLAYLYWDNSTTVLGDRLYIGGNSPNAVAGQVWQLFSGDERVYLPSIIALR